MNAHTNLHIKGRARPVKQNTTKQKYRLSPLQQGETFFVEFGSYSRLFLFFALIVAASRLLDQFLWSIRPGSFEKNNALYAKNWEQIVKKNMAGFVNKSGERPLYINQHLPNCAIHAWNTQIADLVLVLLLREKKMGNVCIKAKLKFAS